MSFRCMTQDLLPGICGSLMCFGFAVFLDLLLYRYFNSKKGPLIQKGHMYIFGQPRVQHFIVVITYQT